ncbi:MAG: S-formylglutathione hydrolase [Pseudomonadota bacterium]
MIKLVGQIKESDGFLQLYQHDSEVCDCTMSFSVYLPPQAAQGEVPALWWLSGLTCTDENFRVKAGAQRYAAELGIALVIPDTSPRGEQVPDDAAYYLGQGAGFYVNATQVPWSRHFRMYDYITHELPAALATLQLPLSNRQSIAGHSMGGHGALVVALNNPEKFRSVSAFAPICRPMRSFWGNHAFSAYLGENEAAWQPYDACCLIQQGAAVLPMLVDQGTADEFYPQELLTEELIAACRGKGFPANIRLQPGYDHSFHFVATFIGEHLRWHQRFLTV